MKTRGMRLKIIAVVSSILVVLACLSISKYLTTQIAGDETTDPERDEIISDLKNRDLVIVKGPLDLPWILGKSRIAKIEFQQTVINHAGEGPRPAVRVGIWSSNLLGKIERKSFLYFTMEDGIACLSVPVFQQAEQLADGQTPEAPQPPH